MFTKRGLELFALSALKKGGRAAGRATVDGFNLINATPDESETHRLGKHKKLQNLGSSLDGWANPGPKY